MLRSSPHRSEIATLYFKFELIGIPKLASIQTFIAFRSPAFLHICNCTHARGQSSKVSLADFQLPLQQHALILLLCNFIGFHLLSEPELLSFSPAAYIQLVPSSVSSPLARSKTFWCDATIVPFISTEPLHVPLFKSIDF